jgi:hypothetical protein
VCSSYCLAVEEGDDFVVGSTTASRPTTAMHKSKSRRTKS